MFPLIITFTIARKAQAFHVKSGQYFLTSHTKRGMMKFIVFSLETIRFMTKKQPVSALRIVRCYWETARHYRWTIGLAFFGFGGGVAISSVLVPLVYQRIIDVISQTNDRILAEPALMRDLWILAGLMVAYQLLYRLGDYATSYSQSKALKDLTDRTFANIERHSYRFFSDNFTGGLVAKSKRFVRAFETLYDNVIFAVWLSIITLVGSLVALFFKAPTIGWVFLVWSVVYTIVAWWLTKKKMSYDAEAADQDSKVSARLADNISTMLVIKMFAAGSTERKAFDSVTDNEEKARRLAWNFQNGTFFIQFCLVGTLEVLGMYLVIRLWLSGAVSAGTVVLVQIYIVNIARSFRDFGRVFAYITRALIDAGEMVEIMDSPLDVADPDKPEAFEPKDRSICFENISFAYPGGVSVFKDFSLNIRPGEKVGLVGASGAGKSTITKLILRFHDPDQGTIRIGGQDIHSVKQDDLRSYAAYVPQESVLFHRSLRENIAYGKPNASMEEIIEAAKKAQAHDFIQALPNGYDTLVGERGVKLSGGERQRVAIARALLKDAPILILDEATSSLDTESEGLIQKALDELMKNKTAIVIAHRLSTVRKMDRIIVLDEGGVHEEGTHDELLSAQSLYAGFWARQTTGFID